MRLAFKTAPQDTGWTELREAWCAADADDVFESGWVFDHFYPIFSDPKGPCLEGWTALTALSAVTERLRLGAMVLGSVYRHPAVLAHMAGTLDVIAGGRLELGLGAAWNEEECGPLGIELPPPAARFDRFEEYLEVVTRLLNGAQPADFEGRFFQLRDARCNPSGQQDRIPIVIGGAGPTRMPRLVARYADHWNFPWNDVATFQDRRARIDTACAEIGRSPGEITTSVQVRASDNAIAGLRERVLSWRDAGVDVCVVYVHPPFGAGVLREVMAGLRDLAQDRGVPA